MRIRPDENPGTRSDLAAEDAVEHQSSHGGVTTGQLFRYEGKQGVEYSMPADWLSMLYQVRNYPEGRPSTQGNWLTLSDE